MLAVKKVTFLRVITNSIKLQIICELVSTLLFKKETLLITVPSMEAANYIDQLLWHHKEESFIPHAVLHAPAKELIAITTEAKNYNTANNLLNLCPQIASNYQEFSMIYELLDFTHPSKENASRERLNQYKSFGYQVVEK